MFRRYIILLIACLIVINVTSCCWYGEAFGEALGEALGETIGEAIVAGLEIDMEMLYRPLILFQKTNDRWPDSKEELAEFSSEMGLNVPALYWDSFEDMHFHTQEDGSLNIKSTRVITGEDGTQYRLPGEYTFGKLKFNPNDPNLVHILQETENTNNSVQRTEGKPCAR